MVRLEASRKANATMTTMTIDQAKDQLADLLAKAAEGEEVVIVREDGSTFAVVPKNRVSGNRGGLIGSARGTIRMADDFDGIPEGFEPYLSDEPDGDSEEKVTTGNDSAAGFPKRSRRSYGIVKGQIWMADDFDDIPEGFEPYLGNGEKAG